MSPRIFEYLVKVSLFIDDIKEGKCGAEHKDAEGGCKADCSDQEPFARRCGRNPVSGHRIGTHQSERTFDWYALCGWSTSRDNMIYKN